MSGFPAGSPTPSRLLGALRVWLRPWSSENCPTSEDTTINDAGANTDQYNSVRVLVVDDDPVNLMVASALMESRGLSPLLAADGAEAVALACETRFDLILMDLQMPILDGLAATAAIRRFENACSRPAVPVVAYSSAPPAADVLAIHGLNGSLAKPCDVQALEACLVEWCPTYRSGPTLRGVPGVNSRWQSVNGRPSSQVASLR